MIVVFILSFFLFAFASLHFFRKKNWLFFILSLSTLVRLVFALLIEGGAKYDLVWDNLRYEDDAWLIAKSWVSGLGAETRDINIYSYFVGILYFLFGKINLLPVWINILLSTVTTWLLWDTLKNYLPQKSNGLIFVSCVSLYPSWLVWSTTAIKDPFILFFSALTLWSLLRPLISTLFYRKLVEVLIRFVLFAFSIYALSLLRNYFLYIFVCSIAVGLLLSRLAHFLRPLSLVALTVFLSFVALCFVYFYMPNLYTELTDNLQRIRVTFTNMGLEDYAQSSFLIDIDISNPIKFVFFWFLSLMHYFFAPFVWAVKNIRQALSLVEALPLLISSPYLLIGFLRAQTQNAKVCLILASIILITATLQSAVISNVGTLFRHRSFIIILLFYFLEWGLWKKLIRSEK